MKLTKAIWNKYSSYNERIRRELRHTRHSNLPERPKVIAWDLDGTLIDNGCETASARALESLWVAGFTHVITTSSPADYALEKVMSREWHHFIDRVHSWTLSGEGKAYRSIAEAMRLRHDEYLTNFIVVGDSVGDVPVDLESIFVLSDNPERVAGLIKELDKAGNFLEGYFSRLSGFKQVAYSRLHDKKKVPVLADEISELCTYR